MRVICITEIYDNELPITWFCDIDKVDPTHPFRIDVENAIKNRNKCGYFTYNEGFQDDNVEKKCSVNPPCQVEDCVNLGQR